MTPEALIAWMLALSPRAVEARTRPIAEAIAAATQDPREARVLVVLSYLETGFGRPGSIPFGIQCCFHRGDTVAAAAARTVAVLHASARACGPAWPARLGWFHTGRCRADAYATRVVALLRRLR